LIIKNEYDTLIGYFEKRYYLLPHYFCNKEYLDREYLPKLKRLESIIKKKDIGIVAGAYEKIADMYDCEIYSEYKALEYFKTATVIDPDFYYSFGEIAYISYCIGNYNDSIKNFNIALKLTKDALIRSELLSSKKITQVAKKNKEKPLTDCSEFHYIAKERLIFGDPDATLRILKNKKDNDSRVLRLCGCLEKDDFDNFYIQLESLIKSKSLVYFTQTFWFYLPQQIKNDIKFWSLLSCRKGKTSFIHSELPKYLQKMYNANYKNSTTADNSNTYNLYFQYQMARLSLDERLIKKLANAHPKWRQIQTLIKKYKVKTK
jgi:hypothetical protein